MEEGGESNKKKKNKEKIASVVLNPRTLILKTHSKSLTNWSTNQLTELLNRCQKLEKLVKLNTLDYNAIICAS